MVLRNSLSPAGEPVASHALLPYNTSRMTMYSEEDVERSPNRRVYDNNAETGPSHPKLLPPVGLEDE